MEKDPKKSGSLAASHAASATGATPGARNAASGDLVAHNASYVTAVKEVKSLFGQGFIKLNFFTLFWLFVIGSLIGLGVETIFHAIVYGGYESRAGLVWGPFSPIYGAGAALLTLFLNRFYYSHNVVIFLVAMVVGSTIEFVTSWGMEFFWGAIAWDYSGTFGSIAGRTNFLFGVMWGMLGLVWVRVILPLVKKGLKLINQKSRAVRIVTLIVTLFMLLNITVTCLAMDRQGQRAAGIAPTNPIEQAIDATFTDAWMQARFENMTVSG
ncbi:MAG: putative ABC transporter permease [Raoultibacter sp.]